jgi:hypothetical protein
MDTYCVSASRRNLLNHKGHKGHTNERTRISPMQTKIVSDQSAFVCEVLFFVLPLCPLWLNLCAGGPDLGALECGAHLRLQQVPDDQPIDGKAAEHKEHSDRGKMA